MVKDFALAISLTPISTEKKELTEWQVSNVIFLKTMCLMTINVKFTRSFG